MIYDSLRLFLDKFCEPTDASVKGMEFAVQKPTRFGFPGYIWLTISPEFDRLKILMVRDNEKEIETSLDLMAADYKTVITEIQEMSAELAEQVA
jgi:hypothetical protein